MSILQVVDIKKVYGSGHAAVNALDNTSLTIENREILLIIGPSGSGKTTLLSILGTLLKPTSGQVIIGNTDVTRMGEKQLHKFRLHNIGFVFQSFNLLSALSAQENVMIPLIAAGKSRKEATTESTILLTDLGLQNRLRHLPRDLSGGEKQRVAIARALANKPSIILADEPTANLDSKTGREVAELLTNIASQESRAIVIVSHDMRLKAIAHRIITIEDGMITSDMTN